MSNWSTGLKLALSVLGVVLFATAIQTFVNWQPSSKFGAGLFTIGAALVAGVVGAKFLPKGATAGLLTAGLALGGYQMVGEKVKEFGETIGNSIRGNGLASTTPGAKGPMGPVGQTGPAGISSAVGMGYGTGIGAGVFGTAAPAAPAPAAPQQVSITYQAPKGPSDFAYVGGEVAKAAGSIFAGVFGSKGYDDLGSGNDAETNRKLALMGDLF